MFVYAYITFMYVLVSRSYVLYKLFFSHTFMLIELFFSFITVEKQKYHTTINHYKNDDECNYWYMVSNSTSISMFTFTLDTTHMDKPVKHYNIVTICLHTNYYSILVPYPPTKFCNLCKYMYRLNLQDHIRYMLCTYQLQI